LVDAGHAASIPDAFNHLIGDASEAFVSAHMLEPADAVDLVVRSGGIAMWAHPPAEIVDELLPSLVESGLRGLEVFRPRNRRSDMLRYESICRDRGLLMSGGSDWHSPNGGSALGDFYVEAEEVDGLLEAGGL
jgi:predicted metal-dependent phosphoesterase TrpH